MMRNDIETREDINRLIADFYSSVMADEKIGHHFTDLDLAEHLPIVADFWEKTLFSVPVYFGNPLAAHQRLHEKSPLKPEHFTRWLEIFCQTVNELFAGEMADAAIQRARMIAAAIDLRLNSSSCSDANGGPVSNMKTSPEIGTKTGPQNGVNVPIPHNLE